MTLYQILVPAISIVPIAYAWNLVSKQKKTLWEAILWTIFWGCLAGIAIFPEVLTQASALMGFKDRENAVIVTAIGILFFVVFYVIVKIEELSQKQARIVRKIALKDLEK